MGQHKLEHNIFIQYHMTITDFSGNRRSSAYIIVVQYVSYSHALQHTYRRALKKQRWYGQCLSDRCAARKKRVWRALSYGMLAAISIARCDCQLMEAALANCVPLDMPSRAGNKERCRLCRLRSALIHHHFNLIPVIGPDCHLDQSHVQIYIIFMGMGLHTGQ